jgi:hypothetical protein
MKKAILLLLLCLGVVAMDVRAQAAGNRNRPALQQKNVLPVDDIPGTAAAITSLLKPKLAISDSQTPKITGIISDFLKSKSGIIPLAQSNPTEYNSKFSALQGRLFSALKPVFTAAQYSKFMGLKPKTSSTGNLLSHLFF